MSRSTKEDVSVWRIFFTCWIPVMFAVIINFYFPWFGGIFWFLIAIFLIGVLNLLWEVYFDWCDLYRNAMHVSDQSARHMPIGGKGYVNLSLPRSLPPRLLWVVIVHDHSGRVYMGWHWWSQKEPDFVKATTRGFRRKQVA
jgi:hypothetical protein